MELTPLVFGLYKLVKYGVYPLTWIVALAGAAALSAWRPPTPARRRRLRLSTAALAALLLLTTSPLIAHLLMATLEGYQPFPARHEPVPAGAIVVLGGGVRDAGSLRPDIELTEESMRRTACGADLYRRGLTPALVITGGDARVFGSGPAEAAVMNAWAVRLGVPPDAILIEDQARTTYENAVRTRHLLGDRTTIILVTSAPHMPRAAALFRAQGFDVIPSPCGFHERNRVTEGWETITLFDVLPAAWAFREVSEALEEVAGIAVYRLAGKL